jgi:PqqD family protein of HPr-rel-A system
MAELLYCRESEDNILERALDGLTLLYHRPSGTTHIIDSPLPEILAGLDDSPVTLEGLRDRLARSFDFGEGGDVTAELWYHLDTLVEQGLVWVSR